MPAVFRGEQEAADHCGPRRLRPNGHAVDEHLAFDHAADAEECLRQFRPPRADQSRQGDDLAAADRERDGRRRTARVPDAAQLQPHRRVRLRRVLACVELPQISADHQPHDGGMVNLFGGQVAGVLPVAQHGDTVRDHINLGQPVRNVEHRDAGFFQLGDHGE